MDFKILKGCKSYVKEIYPGLCFHNLLTYLNWINIFSVLSIRLVKLFKIDVSNAYNDFFSVFHALSMYSSTEVLNTVYKY